MVPAGGVLATGDGVAGGFEAAGVEAGARLVRTCAGKDEECEGDICADERCADEGCELGYEDGTDEEDTAFGAGAACGAAVQPAVDRMTRAEQSPMDTPLRTRMDAKTARPSG